jgi:hypothetical protein
MIGSILVIFVLLFYNIHMNTHIPESEELPSSDENNESISEEMEASDQQIVHFLMGHLQQPCSIAEGNLRSFYIRESERLLTQIKNPVAREQLESALHIAKLVLKVEEEKRN